MESDISPCEKSINENSSREIESVLKSTDESEDDSEDDSFMI
jgi:hypothetical protein